MSIVKCRLCGREIASWESKNPYPLGSDDDRCCDECFSEKVIPARQVMVGQRPEKKRQITVTLSEEFDLWKLERIRDNMNSEMGRNFFTLEDVASDLLSDAIIEGERAI